MNENEHPDIDALVEQEMERLRPARDEAVAQLMLLAERLQDLDLLDPDEDEVGIPFLTDTTGKAIVGIEVGGLRYAFGGAGTGDVLIVRRIVGGHTEHAVLDENGQPIRWHLTAPPEGRAATN